MGYNEMMWRSILLLAMMTGTPSLARADGDVALHGAAQLLRFGELLIPDARYEHSFTAAEDRFVLSLPLVMRAGHVNVGKASGIVFNHMVEFQYEVTRTEFRGVLGERMLIHGADSDGGFMPLLEAGGVVGSDGSGAMVGGGLAWGDGNFGVSIGIVVRFVMTNEEHRADIALDVQVPLNIKL